LDLKADLDGNEVLMTWNLLYWKANFQTSKVWQNIGLKSHGS